MSAIKILHDTEAGAVDVWLDPQADTPVEGLCIGTGETELLALGNAREDLEAALRDINAKIMEAAK